MLLSEDILHADEQGFRKLVENLPFGILIHRNYQPLYVNQIWAEWHGCDVEQVLAMTSILTLAKVDSLTPNDRNNLTQQRRVIAQNKIIGSVCYEYQTTNQKGSAIWLEAHMQSLQWQGQAATLQTVTDISRFRGVKNQPGSQRAQASKQLHRGLTEEHDESRLKDFASASSDWFWELDAELRLIWMSDEIEQRFGIAREKLYGLYWYELFDASMEAEKQSALQDKLHSHKPFRDFEYSAKVPDQPDRKAWVRASGVPIFDEYGNFQGYRGVSRSITALREAQKQAEQKLRDSEEKYRQIFSQETDAVILFDGETLQITDANETALQLYAYKANELLSMQAPDLSATPDLSLEFVHQVLEKSRGRVELRYHRKKNGTIIPVEISMSAFDLKGRSFICAIIRDVSERMLAEEALKKSEQRFKDFAETAADWFWEVDENLNISYLSERYYELTGDSSESLMSLNYVNACSSINDTDHNHHFSSALQARQSFDELEWVYAAHNDDKKLYFMLAGKPFYDSQQKFKGFRGTGRDITDAKYLAKQLNYQATHDSLTGLINRREFEQRLVQALAKVQANGSKYILCYIDLDQFKIVNDSAGHHAGDQLLKSVAELIGLKIRSHDIAARLGGDEFGLLLSRCSLDLAETIAQRIIEDLSEFRFSWDKRLFEIGASIGIVEVSAETKKHQ